jgi:hypothetical protein
MAEGDDMTATAKIGILLTALLALAACNDDRERIVIVDCAGPDLGLDGTWFGAMEDDGGDLFTLEWRICGDTITREIVGGFSSGVTGRLWQTGPGAWRGRLSDGTEFHMLTGPGRRHAMMVNDFFEFAVLERGALGLPRYFFSDLDGTWRGRHALFSSGSAQRWDAWAWCDAGVCDTEDSGGVFATMWFDILERDFGLYRGEFVDSLGAEGIAGALMSSDLLFLGTYTCPSGYQGPADCIFGALSFD